jgi:hypothetical protein
VSTAKGIYKRPPQRFASPLDRPFQESKTRAPTRLRMCANRWAFEACSPRPHVPARPVGITLVSLAMDRLRITVRKR